MQSLYWLTGEISYFACIQVIGPSIIFTLDTTRITHFTVLCVVTWWGWHWFFFYTNLIHSSHKCLLHVFASMIYLWIAGGFVSKQSQQTLFHPNLHNEHTCCTFFSAQVSNSALVGFSRGPIWACKMMREFFIISSLDLFGIGSPFVLQFLMDDGTAKFKLANKVPRSPFFTSPAVARLGKVSPCCL